VQLEEEKQKVTERDIKIRSMLEQLEDYHRLQHEFNNIKEEFAKYQELVQQDLSQQSVSSKAMEKELIALASRNSASENEKQDLLNILEQRDYEIIQLKSLIDLSRVHRRNSSIGFSKMSMDETKFHNNTLDVIMNANVDEQDNNDNDYDNNSDTMREIDNVDEDECSEDNNKDHIEKGDETEIAKTIENVDININATENKIERKNETKNGNENENANTNTNENENVHENDYENDYENENEADNMQDIDNDIDEVIDTVMKDLITSSKFTSGDMQSKDYIRLKEEKKKKKNSRGNKKIFKLTCFGC